MADATDFSDGARPRYGKVEGKQARKASSKLNGMLKWIDAQLANIHQ